MKEQNMLNNAIAALFSAMISLAALAGLGGLVIMAIKFFLAQIRSV